MLMYTVEHKTNNNVTYESAFFTKEDAIRALERSYNTIVEYEKLKPYIAYSTITDSKDRAYIEYDNNAFDEYTIVTMNAEVIV